MRKRWEKESEKQHAGSVIQELRRKRYRSYDASSYPTTGQLENFFFGSLCPSCSATFLLPVTLFYARCFHPRTIYERSERHSSARCQFYTKITRDFALLYTLNRIPRKDFFSPSISHLTYTKSGSPTGSWKNVASFYTFPFRSATFVA